MNGIETPKIFISYSWSSPDHQDWVESLSENLVADGIEIVLDIWELREGDDAHAFMERMVNDISVTKIIMIIDNKYTERANSREGGVGTESTILSNELYTVKDKNKIVAVIAEPNAKTPTFYAGRIYVDLSDQYIYVDEYEKLVRWAYGKYKREKPKTIGKPPSFITFDDSSIVLHTNTEFRIALDAIDKGKSIASGSVRQYLNKLDSEIVKLSIEYGKEDSLSDIFQKNLNSFQPYLFEFQRIIESICVHASDPKIHKHVRYFFESVLKHLQINPSARSRNIHDLTFFEFIIYQLFLSYIALALKHENFSELKEIFEELFILPDHFHRYDMARKHSDFRIFRPEHDRKAYTELAKEKISPLAALFKDLSTGDIISFNQIIEADIFLYLKSLIIVNKNRQEYIWWPYTALYRPDRDGALRVFTKSEKHTYFNEVKTSLGIEDLTFVNHIIPDEFEWSNRYIPRWSDSVKILNIRSLINYEKLEPKKASFIDLM